MILFPLYRLVRRWLKNRNARQNQQPGNSQQ
jgi:hypothetical protein